MSKSKRKSRKAGGGPDIGRPLTLQERAERVLVELRALGRAIGEREGIEPDERFPIDELVLPLHVTFRRLPGTAGKAGQAASLLEDYRDRIAEVIRARSAFRSGRVYCFLCGSASCEHSAPSGPTETFAGYTPTGKPSWVTLPNLLIARADPRIDRIFGERAQVVAIEQSAEELTGELLPGFGRDSLVFSVLGQVVAGLLPSDMWPSKPPGEPFTLTAQIVETRSGRAHTRLRLNIIGLSSDDLAAGAEDSRRRPSERLRRALWDLRRQVESLSRRALEAERRGEPLALSEVVAPVLSRLRHELNRAFRPELHRTHHARERHSGGERPTSSALRDALRASDERLLWDSDRETIVVLGPRGRAHLFARDGRHVTSLQLDAGEVERKTRKKRWGPLDPAISAEWRAAIRGRAAQQPDSEAQGSE